MKTRKIRTWMAILSAVLVLTAVAGCSAGAGGSSGGAPAAPPTLTLDQPAQGAEVPAGDVEVKVTATNLKFTMPSNTNKPGEGHVHFTLDDKPFKMSTEPAYVFKDVAPGAHTLKAELVQNDTKPFDPPVEQEVTFTVK